MSVRRSITLKCAGAVLAVLLCGNITTAGVGDFVHKAVFSIPGGVVKAGVHYTGNLARGTVVGLHEMGKGTLRGVGEIGGGAVRGLGKIGHGTVKGAVGIVGGVFHRPDHGLAKMARGVAEVGKAPVEGTVEMGKGALKGGGHITGGIIRCTEEVLGGVAAPVTRPIGQITRRACQHGTGGCGQETMGAASAPAGESEATARICADEAE